MSTRRTSARRLARGLLVPLLILVAPAAMAEFTNHGPVSNLVDPENKPQLPRNQSKWNVTEAVTWHMFAFTAAGVQATGCAPEDPAGSCGLGPGQIPAGPPPWKFSAPAGGSNLTVVDAFLLGIDQFEVFDFGGSIGTTSVPAVGNCPDPDTCLGDPNASKGTFALGQGTHSITIVPVASEPGGGAAFFRIDVVNVNPVPTLGPLGIGVLVLLLAGLGLLVVRRL